MALAADPDTWVEGAISFDGVTLSPVGVRLKGSTGSARTLDQKAAFKVKLTEYGGERLRGLEELTLNNMVQDASLVHEQLAYTTFRDARVPAPRVAYAAVTLNGEARGVYLHVESPDRTFLARWYPNPDGDLYEGGAHIDLDVATYEQLEVDETGSDPDAATDLAALAALLATDPDEGDVATLESLVDLDELLTMWATEVLLGHWDGYFWFPHNYRVYHDPSTRRFTMLPWGADLTLQEVRSCFHAKGALAVWALRIPSVLDRYVVALGEAADHVDGLPLAADAAALHAVVAPLDDPYTEFTEEESDAELARAVDFVTVWPAAVREGITTGVDPGNDHVP